MSEILSQCCASFAYLGNTVNDPSEPKYEYTGPALRLLTAVHSSKISCTKQAQSVLPINPVLADGGQSHRVLCGCDSLSSVRNNKFKSNCIWIVTKKLIINSQSHLNQRILTSNKYIFIRIDIIILFRMTIMSQ